MEKCLHLCMGLPGSGKTHLLTRVLRFFELIDVDGIWDESACLQSIRDRISDTIDIIEIYNPEVANGIGIDTLILNNDQLVKVLDILSGIDGMNRFEIIIHWFEPNREICLYNDQGRRSLECDFMIRRANVEEVDMERLNELFIANKKFKDIKVQLEEVKRKPLYRRSEEVSDFIDENVNFDKDDIIKSEEWIVSAEGSQYCFLGNFSLPEQEKDFKELTKLLNKFAPKLTTSEYERVWSLVFKERRTNFGYYGLYYEYCVWTINLRELFDLLSELGYVEDDEEGLIINWKR